MTGGSGRQPLVAVLGGGVVGARVTREMVSSHPEIGLSLHSAREDRCKVLRKSFGSAVRVVRAREDRMDDVAASVRVVVLAGHGDAQAAQARRHLEAGRHVVTTSGATDAVEKLLLLDPVAREHDRSLVVGAGFSPGLGCLLAARAASELDVVDEVHIARHGAAGPACAAQRLQSMREEAVEWRDGAWRRVAAGTGRDLAWFPDPVGGKDCYRAAGGEPLLVIDAFGPLRRATVRMVMNRRDRIARPLPILLPPPSEGGIGAVRVEVRGSVGAARSTVVLGALDRPGVAAAAVAAEATLALLAGNGPDGAHGLAAWPDPDAFLRALRVRGIRVAALEAD